MEYPHGSPYWCVYAADKVRDPGTGQDGDAGESEWTVIHGASLQHRTLCNLRYEDRRNTRGTIIQ